MIKMCLAVPGKILSINDGRAEVDFQGVKKSVVVGLLPNAEVGQYVVVHAGYAIQVMSEMEALESIKMWGEIMEKEGIDPAEYSG